MARKPQDNPQLDMTPMIDVVFELIIFFVVTLTESQRKDETIELASGQHGIILDAEEIPPQHLTIDIASVDKRGRWLKTPRVTISDREITAAGIQDRIKLLKDTWGHDFPVFIRADYGTPHKAVADVMDACSEAGVWQLSIMATGEDKTKGTQRPYWNNLYVKEPQRKPEGKMQRRSK